MNGRRVILRLIFIVVVLSVLLTTFIVILLGSNACTPDRTNNASQPDCTKNDLMTSSCALRPDNTLDIGELVEDIDIELTRKFVFEVKLTESFEHVTNNSKSDQTTVTRWVWAIGDRGETYLTFPYDENILSFSTLSYGEQKKDIFLNTGSDITDCCLSQVLHGIIDKVREGINNKTGLHSFPPAEKDIICVEKLHEKEWLPILAYIPGFSFLVIQLGSYYDCFQKGIYSCICWTTISITLAVEIALVVAVVVVYKYGQQCLSSTPCNTTGESDQCEACCGRQDSLPVDDGGESSADEYVDILDIPLVPLILWIDGEKKREKCILFLLLAVPEISYIIALICHVCLSEFIRRLNLICEDLKIRIITLDLVFGNIAYVIGLVALYHVHEFRRIVSYIIGFVAFLFCVVRFFSFLMLIIEVIALTLTGIAIYIQVVPAFWINIVVGIAHVIGAVYAFFDRYQFVFKNIYKVGSRIDKEGHWWKVFKNSCPSDAEEQRPEHRKCEISCRLLRKIVQNELPFAQHAETSIRRLLSFLAIIILLGALTYFIEKETNTLFIGQYVLTVVPLTLLELRNLPRNPCSTKNKEDLHSQGLQRALKENLRKYAQTGEYPTSQQRRRSSASNNRTQDHGNSDRGEPATRESATPQESTALETPLREHDVAGVNAEAYPGGQGGNVPRAPLLGGAKKKRKKKKKKKKNKKKKKKL